MTLKNKYQWLICNESLIFPLSDLPVSSPLCNAVLKTLENWEQLLLEQMNKFESPPPNYINTYPTDLSAGGGPAILRHKAMLEPDNTPFKWVRRTGFKNRTLFVLFLALGAADIFI